MIARISMMGIVLTLLYLPFGMLSPCASGQATMPAKKPVLPAAPAGVVIEQDLLYLESARAERLDLYLPTNRKADVRSPAVLIIHGGGWVNGDKADYRQFNIGTNLAQVGYVCISVNYMMTPGQRWPTNLLDCKNAVRFLRKNAEKYQIDPDHIGVIGGSAGGHLSLMVAYTTDVPELEPQQPYPGISDRVQCVVNLYGITNLLSRQKTDARGNPIGSTSESTALLQKTRPEDPHLWQLASPVYHISAKTPPTLILHGTADTTVDRDQAAELARKLQEANVLHELVMVPGIGHTFDLQTWNHKPLPVDVRGIVIGFFDKHLK